MKIFKRLGAIVVAFVIMFTSVDYVNASTVVNEGTILDENNQPFFIARDSSLTGKYIWSKLRTSDGNIAYCLDFGMNWPDSASGIQYNDNFDYADPGLIYILKNGASDYNNPTNQERYITQGAVWLYVTNSNTFSPEFDDPHGLLPVMNNLVSRAKQAKASGSVDAATFGDIKVSSTDMLLSEDGKYYESSVISPEIYGVNTYSVTASSGAEIVSSNGSAKSTFSKDEGFKVRMSSSVGAGSSVSAEISISTTAYVLTPDVNYSSYQRVISLGNTVKTISKKINLATVDTVCVDYKIVGNVIPDASLTDPTPGKNCMVKGTNYTQEGKLTTRTDCTFKGWFTTSELAGYWTDGDALNNNMTLYGAWECPEKVSVPPTAASTPLIILGTGLTVVAAGFGYYIFKNKKA